jgi:ornithine carbamoyltransferase
MIMHRYASRHLLSIDDLDQSEFDSLLALCGELRWPSFNRAPLAGQNIVLIFEKPSLRTRVTFEVAVRKLGGWPVILDGEKGRLGERESIPDMARNLSLWVDGIVARVYSHASLRQLASCSDVPVVNALSDLEHPCQALADLMTLAALWHSFEGRTLVYVGDWNNVSRSLAKASALAGLSFRAVCPEQYGPATEEAVEWSSRLDDVKGADAIYTDVWASMGQEDEFKERLPIFAPYQVNDNLLSLTGKPTLFMHCLPAHRGLEVTDSVIDSDRSIVFQQAANRLPAEMAVLIFLLEHRNEATYQESRPGLFGRSRHLNHHSMAQGKLRM